MIEKAASIESVQQNTPIVSGFVRLPFNTLCLPWQPQVGARTKRARFTSNGMLVNLIIALLLALHLPIHVDATAWPDSSSNKHSDTTKQLSLRKNRNLQSNEVFYDIQAIIRRVIPRFRLELFPVPQSFTIQDENILAGIMDKVVVSYVKSKSSLFPDPDATLDYLLLAGIESDVWYSSTGGRNLASSTSSTTVLTFKGGVAYFRGVSAPDVSQITSWLKEGLEQKLPEALVGTPYSYIQTAIFTSLTVAPTAAPIRQHTTDGALIQQYKTSDSPSKGLISGSVVGGFALLTIVLVALVLVRRRSRNTPDDLQSKAARKSISSVSQVGSDLTNLPPRLQQRQQQQQQQTLPEVLPSPVPPAPLLLSDDDDNSSFTASTRTEHSNMLPSSSGPPKRPYAVTESFERDRPTSLLRKDMLDSTWNRSTSPGRLQSFPGRQIVHNDTVLQPSHFSASGERRRRKKKPRSDGANDEEEEWYFSESKEEVGNEGFRFESADGGGHEGEEVYLVPPSPRSGNRPSSPNGRHSLV